MIRSVSQPSLGTTATFPQSIQNKTNATSVPQSYRGQRMWEGRLGVITRNLVLLPYSSWWQLCIITHVIYKFIVHFLLGYHLIKQNQFWIATLYMSEVVFYVDAIVMLLHQFWPLLRIHVRVCRQNYMLQAFDLVSLVPIYTIGTCLKIETMALVGRWLKIGRIYRLIGYFYNINNTMRQSRVLLYFVEHVLVVVLVLHGFTCIWYGLNREEEDDKEWYKLGYPEFLTQQKIKFDTYLKCWYYCSCRIFNCIFGDSFPITPIQKIFTTFMMLFGFVFVRFRFIGFLAWELILRMRRWSKFLEQYHHVVNYLKSHNAPQTLVEQTKLYKQHLWSMKDGIRSTEYLKKFPQPLQMELIFDINVGHFHDSLLLKDTGEAFMRHISLLMKHELYMAGQHVWSQGVVKSGLVCIRSGVLELLSEEDDESPVIAFKEGTVLGEVSLFYSIPSKVTVKAATYVELQVLQRTDFMLAMSEHPQILRTIRAAVEARIAGAKSREEAIHKYEKNDLRQLRTRYRPMKTLKDHLNGVEDEDTVFVDDSHMYYKDENNKRQPKFTTEYLELYKISENVSAIDTPKICLKGTFPWILEPNTTLTSMWEVCHFATVLHICVFSPLTTISDARAHWQEVFDALLYTVLVINVYVQLTTAVVKKNVRKETTKEIVQDKMASFGFYVDVISIFPFYVFTDTLDPDRHWQLTKLAIMLPMLQAWHLWDYFDKWQDIFETHVKLLCFLKYTLVFCLLCHWSGCFLYIIACPNNVCLEKSWFDTIILWETKLRVALEPMHERPIHTSLLFGTLTLTATGGTQIPPGKRDYMLVIIIVAIGVFLASFYIANICSHYFLASKRKLAFKDSMRELFYFLSVNRVSSKIKTRVENFFCVQWYYNEAVSTEEIFETMSSSIQREIMSVDMIETLVRCPMFQNCSKDFLQTVASHSRIIVLPQYEIVQHAGDIGRDMYVVKMGHCMKLDHTGHVLPEQVVPGDSIGTLEMLYGLPKVHTVKTTTNCILVHVEYTALIQSWGLFPNIRQPIFDVLEDPEILERAMAYENGKPLVGHIDAKRNRIAKEIKESVIFISNKEYLEPFEKLGVLKYLKYFFVRASITPHGLFLKFWCVLRLIVALYYVTMLPYKVSTKQSKWHAAYHYTDIYLYVDMVVMSYVAYYDDKSLLVTHPLLTFTNYVKHGFLLDLVSVFPIEEFCKVITETGSTDIYRANRILLVIRIINALTYYEGDIMRQNQEVVLLKFLPAALVVVNVATALVVAHDCAPHDITDAYVRLNCTRNPAGSHADGHSGLTYAMTEYIRTFFWIFEVFVGCGCSATTAASTYACSVRMAVSVLGALYAAFMFGYVTSTRAAASHALLEHNEKTKDLENFLYQENVDPELTVKTLNYFKYVWKRTHGSDAQKPISCSEVAIYASRSLDLLVIPSQSFFSLIKFYPKVQDLLNKALETSGDYILPITMDDGDDDSSDDNMDIASVDSDFDCKSSISTLATGSISVSQSRSNLSQAKSFASVLTFNNVALVNLKRPGSLMYQIQGYITCVMATLNVMTVSYEMVTLNDCGALFWLQAVFDLCFYVRLYLIVHEGYINRHGDLILDSARCRRRYFKHKLWVYSDFIVNVPLELFGLFFEEPLYAMHFFRANKLLRLKYLIQFYRASSKELTNNLTVLQTVTTGLVMVLTIHTLACCWLLALISSDPMCLIRPAKMHLVDTDTPTRLWDYSTSLYVVVSELTTTGGDEYYNKSILSVIILAICLVLGKILASVVVAISMQISHFTKYALNVYEKETLEVIDYLKNQGLSQYQYNKFWKYIQQLWKSERGRQLPELIQQIPYVLRCDVMSALFGHHLRNCYLFSDTSQHFLRQLAVLLDYNVFFPGNYIVVSGDSEARMYWVASGVVSVVSVRSDLTETTHELLHAGDLFGIVQGLNKGIPHHFSYRAETQVGIISLSSDSWLNILPHFPEVKALISLKSEVLFSKI
ncbi:uncharacterized protein LOC121732490 isoform X2 [Aricia agestis]|uniref:uncharacterized protein LOC121732490 isoform X2 n=1 Tax=Aricia agestis TaxID=91739 RepID=UPI001C20B530|nr:uncharacterized protein LOC121732490 isoform X2 [Aricia agestis]